jgi:DNA-binding MarR family transcriptional regulator
MPGPSNSKNSAYIRFLNLIDVLDRINPGKKLDATEESLLNKIVLSAHQGQVILVGDLISLAEFGSQATLHGRLKNLRAMGLIEMTADEDGRKKHVVPTKSCHEALRRTIQMLGKSRSYRLNKLRR